MVCLRRLKSVSTSVQVGVVPPWDQITKPPLTVIPLSLKKVFPAKARVLGHQQGPGTVSPNDTCDFLPQHPLSPTPSIARMSFLNMLIVFIFLLLLLLLLLPLILLLLLSPNRIRPVSSSTSYAFSDSEIDM